MKAVTLMTRRAETVDGSIFIGGTVIGGDLSVSTVFSYCDERDCVGNCCGCRACAISVL